MGHRETPRRDSRHNPVRMRLVRPSPADPRLRLSLIVGGIQVIGQVGLGFELSIAQILAPIIVCALVEAAITAWRRRELAWPASAVLTGNSTALLLRAPGTRHGDWWATRGLGWFVLAALIGLTAKYLVRYGPRHIYNPSNLGLVAVLLLVGSPAVAPMFLWWGPVDGWLIAVYVLIVLGGAWVLRPLGMLPLTGAYMAAFAGLVGVVVAGGTCFVAIWHAGPVCESSAWLNLALSPEVLVFAFLMISDPRTTPTTARGRIAFGLAVAFLGAAMIAFERSEFGVKLAILAALAAMSPFVPLFDRIQGEAIADLRGRSRKLVLALTSAVTFVVLAATVSLAYNERTIESDLPPALPLRCAVAREEPVQLPPASPCS